MTVNEIALQLIREALFFPRCEKSALSINESVWEEVYEELKSQTVLGLISDEVLRRYDVPEEIRKEWQVDRCSYIWKYFRLAEEQEIVCDLLQNSGITVAVMKGMAAAIYYPNPMVRAMGDIDIIVKPKEYKRAINVLEENNYIEIEREGNHYHRVFGRNGSLIELHNSPSGIHRIKTGKAIREYILSGMGSIEINQRGERGFPILPWKQNGMELIWHIRQHLYNGLGLRQIIDWMMFVYNMLDDKRMEEYMPDLEKCGLDQLAKVVTKMCQKYLGLTHDNITWCDSAEEGLCDFLIQYIFEQGNFGAKVTGDKTAKVLSGYQSPAIIIKKLQFIGEAEWGLLKKIPILKPFAFIYGLKNEFQQLIKREGGLRQAIGEIRLGRERGRMLSKIYAPKKISHKTSIYIRFQQLWNKTKDV